MKQKRKRKRKNNSNIMYIMLSDINIQKLFIILIFIFIDDVNKPNFIKKYVTDFPILKWIIFSLIVLKNNKFIYLLLIFMLYQIFYIFDTIYFKI